MSQQVENFCFRLRTPRHDSNTKKKTLLNLRIKITTHNTMSIFITPPLPIKILFIKILKCITSQFSINLSFSIHCL